jgi:hypothetical protein
LEPAVRIASLIVVVVGLALAMAARAERPMVVDDASTLPVGGTKVEFGWRKDDRLRGLDGAVGYGPLAGLEVELGFGRDRDRGTEPAATIRSLGAQLKWVPWQADEGLSAGLKAGVGRDNLDGGEHARGWSLDALFTWTWAAGPRLHVNAGGEWQRRAGERERATTWGVGVDWPLSEALEVTVERFGARHAAPDSAVGLRYAIAEGLKISAAVGRGSDRTIANAGVAWEF